MKGEGRAVARIDLDRLCHNYRLLLARVRQTRPGAPLWCVVKADAYGHGLTTVVSALRAAGARHFCVADVREAALASAAAPDATVLVLGDTPPDEAQASIRPGTILSVWSEKQAAALRRAVSGPLRLALALDVGMNRLGLSAADPPAVLRAAAAVAALPEVTPDSVYAHLSEADDCKSTKTPIQIQRFHEICRAVDRQLGRHVPTHVCATAGVIRFGTAGCDGARAGLGLYGYTPGPSLALAGLLPVLTLTAPLVALRRLSPGETVGYGGEWRAERPTTVGILPLGYADGLPRACRGGRVLFLGHPVTLVGRISMDLCAVDLGDLPAAVGDRCTVYDRSGKTLRGLAARAGTIEYELLSMLGRRVERRYIGGRKP